MGYSDSASAYAADVVAVDEAAVGVAGLAASAAAAGGGGGTAATGTAAGGEDKETAAFAVDGSPWRHF